MKEALYYEYIVPEKRIKLYEYKELSETAKEKVRAWFIDDELRGYLLTDDFKELWINYYFPNSKLDVEWQLCYCQGDGVNVGGNFDFDDLISYAKHSNWKIDFTEKEMKRLHYYMDNTEIKVGKNKRYGYCVVQSDDYFVTDWTYDLSYCKNLDEDLLERLSSLFCSVIRELCRDMKNYGYKFLYEPDDEEIVYMAEANDWLFDEFGNVVYDYDELKDFDIAQ